MKLVGIDGGQRLGHAVDEWFDAEKAGMRPLDRLCDHRLAAAKADFELNVADRHGKQRAEFGRSGSREIDREARQQRVDQQRLVRAQLVTFTPPEKRAGGLRCWNVRHRSCSARAEHPVILRFEDMQHRRLPDHPQARMMTAGDLCRNQRNARLSASARSVRSHEKPPSLSGARPK